MSRGHLYQRGAEVLRATEWAETVEHILHLTDAERQDFEQWMEAA